MRAEVERQGGDPLAVRTLDCSWQGSCPPSSDLTLLAALGNLTSLDLSGRCTSDISPLAVLTGLEQLRLARNSIADIRPLGALRRLRVLDLADNAILPLWAFKTRAPFSELTQLEELNLDNNFLANLLPLESVTSARKLSLRNNDLFSLRMLRTLRELRSLHVDWTLIEDLSPLAELSNLTELTLDENQVGSVEPLRALVAGGEGRLRAVSLRNNCTASCDALEGAEYDCSDQYPECVHYEQTAPAQALSVPVELVEHYAPKHFPSWSPEQLRAGFALIRADENIAWDRPRGNCDGRAAAATALLKAAGFPESTKVFAFGNLRALTDHDRAGFVSFGWHVAVAVRAQTADGGSAFMVLDPAFDDAQPLALKAWYARLVDSRTSALNFSCADYWRGLTADPELYCRTNAEVAVNERGELEVDELTELRGTVCFRDNCFPI